MDGDEGEEIFREVLKRKIFDLEEKRKNPIFVRKVLDVDDDREDGTEEEEEDEEVDEEDDDGDGTHGVEIFNEDVDKVVDEEELGEDEHKRLLEGGQDNPDLKQVSYVDNDHDRERNSDVRFVNPSSSKDPTIWRVKCKVECERQTSFFLMQKFTDLQSLGTKLEIISAFSLERTKGFIYIEADRRYDVIEACKGLSTLYSSQMLPVPQDEVFHLFFARNKVSEVSKGMWGRLKRGTYGGDLAKVVAVDNEKRKAMIKLVPRIDLLAMAKKRDGDTAFSQTDVPAPKLVLYKDLKGFQDHIKLKPDRLTGDVFMTIDGLMLKAGFLYKNVTFESLFCSNVFPTETELHTFNTPKNEAYEDLEWLSGLYTSRRKCLAESYNGTLKKKDTSEDNKEDDASSPTYLQDSWKSLTSRTSPSKANFNIREVSRGCRGNTHETFSIGQTLRIRVGPLKGHLCHVVSLHPSNVTVKIDTQENLVKVKRENLSEAGLKSVRFSDSNTVKALDEPQQGGNRDHANSQGQVHSWEIEVQGRIHRGDGDSFWNMTSCWKNNEVKRTNTEKILAQNNNERGNWTIPKYFRNKR